MTHAQSPDPAADLAAHAARIRWWHTIELAPGLRTRGEQGGTVDGTAETLARLHLPDLTGKTVLDVGAWDGAFSFAAERNGAARVLATDWFSWGGGGWGTQDGFRLAREALRSKVEDLRVDVPDLSPERVGTWDVVLFLGVFYHLKDPLRCLERVASVAREMIVLETHVDLRLGEALPAMVFYPRRELDDDPTNWWGPNRACVEQMLDVVGFGDVRMVDDWVTRHLPDTVLGRVSPAWRERQRRRFGRTRMTFHARATRGGGAAVQRTGTFPDESR